MKKRYWYILKLHYMLLWHYEISQEQRTWRSLIRGFFLGAGERLCYFAVLFAVFCLVCFCAFPWSQDILHKFLPRIFAKTENYEKRVARVQGGIWAGIATFTATELWKRIQYCWRNRGHFWTKLSGWRILPQNESPRETEIEVVVGETFNPLVMPDWF